MKTDVEHGRRFEILLGTCSLVAMVAGSADTALLGGGNQSQQVFDAISEQTQPRNWTPPARQER